MIILAIDPGITGAVAIYDTTTPHRIVVDDMPILDGDVDVHDLLSTVRIFPVDLAIVEQVSPMPKEGVRSVWRFSAAYTAACVVVKLANIPLMLVTPAKWKKACGLGGGKEGKEQARERAIDRFPFYHERFKLKKHHGRAEASLLAVYASELPTTRNHHDELRQG
jgi:hypothetical protein